MNSTAELQIDNYLKGLRGCLTKMPDGDREEIVREISAHIRECAQEPGSSIGTILERLGSPEGLAAQYGQDLPIRRASRSISPLIILRGTLHLAKRGVEGMVLFLGALLGYTLGGGLVLTAVLKPIFPRQTGLWIGPGVFDFGIHELRHSEPVHEVLGWWYIPIALSVGCFFLWLTTYGIRRFLRRSRQRGAVFAHRRTGMQTSVVSFILLASLVAAAVTVTASAAPLSSVLTRLPSGIGTRGGRPNASTARFRLLINITRDAVGGLRIHLDLRENPKGSCTVRGPLPGERNDAGPSDNLASVVLTA